MGERFPYKFKHVSVFKRGNCCGPDDPWIMAWRDPITHRRRTKTLSANTMLAKRRARKKSRLIKRILSGRYSARKQRISEGRRTDVFELLKKFRRSLKDKGDSGPHVRITYRRCRRVLRKINAQTYEDITTERVTTAIASLCDNRHQKRPLLNAGGRNVHLAAMRNFCHFLKKNHYAVEHLLEDAKRFRGEPVIKRRAITPQQVRALLDAAIAGEPFKGVSGAERALIYEVCIVTGMRANEARQLRINDFALEIDQPFIHLRAETVKGKKKERFQPITSDLADRLVQHLFGRAAHDLAFRVPKECAEMLRADLAAAGIPYVQDGERFDFHSLRVEHASLSLEMGASIKVVSESLGHADITTTMRYLKFIRPKMEAKRLASNAVGTSIAAPDSSCAAQSEQIKNSA